MKQTEDTTGRVTKTGRLFSKLKNKFLNHKNVQRKVKVKVVQRVAVTTLINGCESWTWTDKMENKINATKIRFLRKIEKKTRMDRIRNETYRQQLDTRSVEEIIQE